MKVLLVGNYRYLMSQSMDRFAEMLDVGLRASGHEVRLLKPPPLIGRLLPRATGLGKWLGYLDRFFLFIPMLRRAVDWADVIHICDHSNALYVPWLGSAPHIVTCHDVLAIRSAKGEIPDHRTGSTGRLYQHWILRGLERARHVVCVSALTREQLMSLTGLDAGRVSVVRNGLNYPYRRMHADEAYSYLDQMGVSNAIPFFIHVGNNNWYKNRPGLLRIFYRLVAASQDRDWKLVFAGARLTKDLHLLASRLGVKHKILELPNVSNEELCALYSTAEGLIFPSLAEGFGWPIVEAQACGCPVFTSNRRPMTDVGGMAAAYFDPDDACGAAALIRSGLSDTSRMRRLGYENAEEFSAASMISGYLRTYDSLGA